MNRTRRLRLRHLLVALALLSGLFAMHGVAHHGEHLPSAQAAVGHHAPDAPDHGDGESMAMALCLAALLGATVSAFLQARRRAGRPLLLPRIGRAGAVGHTLFPQVHDPPTPWSLSVCRC